MLKYFLLLLFSACIFNGVAQDKMLLLNGVTDRGKLIEETEELLKFKIYKKGGKEKIILYDRFRVFSHVNSEGVERVLYKKDSTLGSYLSESQMRMFIYGERDARNNYKNSQHALLGGILGGTIALFDTYEFDNSAPNGAGFFKQSPTFFPILSPLVVTFGASLLNSKISRDQVSDLAYLSSEEYIKGFKKIRKFRKVKGSFLGSIVGVTVGLVAYQFGKPN